MRSWTRFTTWCDSRAKPTPKPKPKPKPKLLRFDFNLFQTAAGVVHRFDRGLELVFVAREIFALVGIDVEIEELVVVATRVNELHAHAGSSNDRALRSIERTGRHVDIGVSFFMRCAFR